MGQTVLLSGPFKRHLNAFVISPAIWWTAELWVGDAAVAVWTYLTVDVVEWWYLFIWKIPHCFFFSFWVAEATWPVAKTEILGSYYLDPDPSMGMPCNFTVPQLHFQWEQRQWHPKIALSEIGWHFKALRTVSVKTRHSVIFSWICISWVIHWTVGSPLPISHLIAVSALIWFGCVSAHGGSGADP